MPDVEVDAIGLLCPLPVLKARKTLNAMQSGQVLAITASDAMAQVDMPAFCREAGHELVEVREVAGGQLYVIRRG